MYSSIVKYKCSRAITGMMKVKKVKTNCQILLLSNPTNINACLHDKIARVPSIYLHLHYPLILLIFGLVYSSMEVLAIYTFFRLSTHHGESLCPVIVFLVENHDLSLYSNYQLCVTTKTKEIQ